MKAEVKIPEGYLPIKTGDLIQEGDRYLSSGMIWELFRHNIGKPLKEMPVGSPAIRPETD